MHGLDSLEWDGSQSGRRKQNFGPKTNFKKQKLRIGSFRGFPSLSQFIQERLNTIPLLANFQTIEQCSLEYNPEHGACIEPHIDDCWVILLLFYLRSQDPSAEAFFKGHIF